MRHQVVRRDDRYLSRCRWAFAAIGLAIAPTVMAMVLAGPFGMMGVPIMLWLAGSSVLGWYVFVHQLNAHRCPQCDRVLPRVEESRPSIRFRCAPCGVDWDVERTEG